LEHDITQAMRYTSPELKPLWFGLSLHERCIAVGNMQQISDLMKASYTYEQIKSWLDELATSELLHTEDGECFEIPTEFIQNLRSMDTPIDLSSEQQGAWLRAFVEVHARLADSLVSQALERHSQILANHRDNFQCALRKAEELNLVIEICALTNFLAVNAHISGDLTVAKELFIKLAEAEKVRGSNSGQASAYFQLGRIAQDLRDFVGAEEWFCEALQIEEQQFNQYGIASNCHQLGRIAQEQGDLVSAESWFLRSIEIWESNDIENFAAITYHQLGVVAQQRGDFRAAETWYNKSLTSKIENGNAHGAAITYHQLGSLAEDKCDLETAVECYRKAYDLEHDLQDHEGLTVTCGQLATIAHKWGDFEQAEHWYNIALDSEKYQHNLHGEAIVLHQLGRIAQDLGKFEQAENYYLLSLDLKQQIGHTLGVANTQGQLGILAGLRHQFIEAGRWLIKSIVTFMRHNDASNARRSIDNFLLFYKDTPPQEREYLQKLWIEAKLGAFPQLQ
jgi:tetratricopeptide (TPR) repeat protein